MTDSKQNENSNSNNNNNSAKQKIVICGGGNAAHIFLGLSVSNPNNEVHLLSLFRDEAARFEASLNDKSNTKPGQLIIDCTQENKQIVTEPKNFTNDPTTCLPNADLVIISLPAFAHAQYLSAIAKHVGNHKCLIALFPGSSGLECDWQSLVVNSCEHAAQYSLLSCITLPWAARIKTFGQFVENLGTKATAAVCLAPSKNSSLSECIQSVQSLIGELPVLVDDGHLMNMSVGNINAIGHPMILYGQWLNWDGQPLVKKPLFYQGLTELGCDLMSRASYETMAIAEAIEKETQIKLHIEHVYQWDLKSYGETATDTSSLLMIIRTNPAYAGLTHPMKVYEKEVEVDSNANNAADDGKDNAAAADNEPVLYVPNFNHRYLNEDIPYGLCVIKGIALLLADPPKTDAIDVVLQWAQKIMNKSYFIYKENSNEVVSVGPDIDQTRAPQKYKFTSIKQLV